MYSAIDFLKNDGYIILYAIALIFSLHRYSKYFDTILKYLPILLGYVFLTEILGYLVKWNENFQLIYLDGFSIENSVVYNVFDLILFLYFYFIYWKVLKTAGYRSFVKYGAIIFILVSLVNPFFQNFLILPQIYSLTIGSIVLVICVLLYLIELKTANNGISNSRNLLFWISLGLLAFYITYPIVMIIGIYYGELYRELNIKRFHLLTIVLMYSFFITGFIRMRKMKPVQEEENVY